MYLVRQGAPVRNRASCGGDDAERPKEGQLVPADGDYRAILMPGCPEVRSSDDRGYWVLAVLV